jgi:hypothetical protein
MSVRVTDPETVALYDSTTGLAFGPTFGRDYEAEDFLEWCEGQDLPHLTTMTNKRIEALVVEWEKQRATS